MKKRLKNILLVTGVFMMALLVSGCGQSSNNLDSSLEDIMTKLYADIPDDEKPMALENIEVNDENVTSFIGTDKIKYDEILASESMIGSIAHSVVLVKLKNGEDVEKAKKEISEKVNPRKWICVGVEKEDVIIKNQGDIILVVIVENEQNRNKIADAFDKLK